MKPDDIPQWAWDEAAVMAESVVDKNEACGCDDCLQSMSEKFSRALLSAKAEAYEEAAKICDERNSGDWEGIPVWPDGPDLAAAIRSKAKEIFFNPTPSREEES